jgi:hypothetical protein
MQRSRRQLLGRLGLFNKAGKDLIARRNSQNTNIGALSEGHGSSKLLLVMEDKDNLDPIVVCGEGALMIVDLLAVVLRRQQRHGTKFNIVGVWNLDDMLNTNTIVIQDGLLDCSNLGVAGDAIEAFDVDTCLLGWSHKVTEVIFDTGGGPDINQKDIVRVRVKDGLVG